MEGWAMLMIPGKRYLLLMALLCGALLWTLACDSREKVAGTYKAEGAISPKQGEVSIELKEDGEGAWRKGDEEVPLSWYMKGGELRLNTKGGGVLVGKLHGEEIRMTLPGGKILSFRKVK
jgi:NOL1/NOP2/fmu family ribosome biogenesis protein